MRKYESDLISDIYDYLFENNFNIGTNFKDEFSESYVDEDNARIHLESKNYGKFIVKMERVSE